MRPPSHSTTPEAPLGRDAAALRGSPRSPTRFPTRIPTRSRVPARVLGRVLVALSLGGTSLLLTACGSEPPNLHSPGTTIVCLGDSITAGVGSGGAGYPQLLEELLGVPVIDHGVPGDTASAGLARLDRALAEDPWLVIVELGGNDVLRRIPRERTAAALTEIVERVLAAGAVPLLIELDGPFLGGLEDVFERLEDQHGVPVLDDVLGEILFDPELKSDSIHPNDAGYRRLAEAVAKRVRPWLRERGET